MATTYLIKLETIQFDELTDCSASQSPLLTATGNIIQEPIQFHQDTQFYKTINTNGHHQIIATTTAATATSITPTGDCIDFNPYSCNSTTSSGTNTLSQDFSIGSKGSIGGCSSIYNYDSNTMQIVQLETPIEFQQSLEMSDSSSNNTSDLNSSSAINVCDKIKVHQRKLNKYVRIRFREEFGTNFLLSHDLHECDQARFERLRKECLTLFKPPGVTERTAWARAKQSLRLMRNAMLKT